MADSIEDLQSLDQHVQRTIELLNQAEQALEEIKLIADKYAPGSSNSANLAQATADVKAMITGASNKHNDLVAHLKLAQEEAQQQQEQQQTAAGDSDNPYG